MKLNAMLEDELKKIGENTADKMVCPSCQKKIIFVQDPSGNIYCCTDFPLCNVMTRAHKTGEPMGRPANGYTRYLRSEAHKVFDALWIAYRGTNDQSMVRRACYGWLASKMGMEEVHFGNLNDQALKQAITITKQANIDDILKWQLDRVSAREKALFVRGIIRPKK